MWKSLSIPPKALLCNYCIPEVEVNFWEGGSTIVEVEESAAFADIKGCLNVLTTTPIKKKERL